jgi:hypothetical protein
MICCTLCHPKFVAQRLYLQGQILSWRGSCAFWSFSVVKGSLYLCKKIKKTIPNSLRWSVFFKLKKKKTIERELPLQRKEETIPGRDKDREKLTTKTEIRPHQLPMRFIIYPPRGNLIQAPLSLKLGFNLMAFIR